MCQYHLDVCPYPHQDPISIAVLDVNKYRHWTLSDLPRPWGRLSCGNLSIHHPVPISYRRDSSSSESGIPTIAYGDSNTRVASHGAPQVAHPEVLPEIKHNSSTTSSEGTSLSEVASTATSGSMPYDASLSSSWTTISTSMATPSQHSPHMAQCDWCTATLKALSYKSQEVQTLARRDVETMEAYMNGSLELRALRRMITSREAELDKLRARAWVMANELGRSNQNHKELKEDLNCGA